MVIMPRINNSNNYIEQSNLVDTFEIQPNKNRYPFSIVWGTLPLISWFLPFIGHVGIADSTGKIHDFAGSYYISIDNFMVGSVLKYYQYDIREFSDEESIKRWDSGIQDADKDFKCLTHNICCNNCHDHTARALTLTGRPTSMLQCWYLVVCKGKYASWGSVLSVYLPLLVLVGLIILFTMVKF